MRIQQATTAPCSLCVLILQLGELSKPEQVVYGQHLRLHHHLQQYHIDR